MARMSRSRTASWVIAFLVAACDAAAPAPASTGGLGQACTPDGWCNVGLLCSTENTCIPACYPNCAGHECGPDGCGGTCPPGCPTGMMCDEPEGTCSPLCSPNCASRECGDDGCEGSCGSCGVGEYCAAGGACATSCADDCDPAAYPTCVDVMVEGVGGEAPAQCRDADGDGCVEEVVADICPRNMWCMDGVCECMDYCDSPDATWCDYVPWSSGTTMVYQCEPDADGCLQRLSITECRLASERCAASVCLPRREQLACGFGDDCSSTLAGGGDTPMAILVTSFDSPFSDAFTNIEVGDVYFGIRGLDLRIASGTFALTTWYTFLLATDGAGHWQLASPDPSSSVSPRSVVVTAFDGSRTGSSTAVTVSSWNMGVTLTFFY